MNEDKFGNFVSFWEIWESFTKVMNRALECCMLERYFLAYLCIHGLVFL